MSSACASSPTTCPIKPGRRGVMSPSLLMAVLSPLACLFIVKASGERGIEGSF